MHYVTGGSGTPVVLLHGWPQTWSGWWPIMPELAKHHTVYAVDLPGLGDSTGSPTGYDKATLARYVHTLIADRLGVDDARVVGHAFGAAVAFQYSGHFPDDTARLGYLDLPLPGPAIDGPAYRSLSRHIAFHSQRRVPEAVVGDDVRTYLALFYPQARSVARRSAAPLPGRRSRTPRSTSTREPTAGPRSCGAASGSAAPSTKTSATPWQQHRHVSRPCS
ncbi:alpha/beta fold hydrolase [Streptomyces sp. NPDC048558]|uniref:alpha/beta fold hydrolase n=1 Tax=Streptomyces sp. NPDC048558 TaxID=3155759 RepID=UPI00342DA802